MEDYSDKLLLVDIEERIEKHGFSILDESELIILILRLTDVYCTQNNKVKIIEDMLFESRDMDISLFKHATELSYQDCYRLMASLELGKRVIQRRNDDKITVSDSTDVYEYLKNEVTYLDQEQLIGVYVDAKGSVIKKDIISIGTLNCLMFSTRDIFRRALILNAYGIFLVHNHPSGDSRISNSDVIASRKIKEAGKLFGIELIDHIIIGKYEFTSMNNRKTYKY